MVVVIVPGIGRVFKGELYGLGVHGRGLAHDGECGGVAFIGCDGGARVCPLAALHYELDGVVGDSVLVGVAGEALVGEVRETVSGHSVDGFDVSGRGKREASLSELLLAGGDKSVLSAVCGNSDPLGVSVIDDGFIEEDLASHLSSEVDVDQVFVIALCVRIERRGNDC